MKDIAEVPMKRQWTIRRQFQPTMDAERRWDQAYQHLLEWTLLPPSRPSTELEARYEDRDLRAGVDQPSDPGSND
jgi:hypothetical protein